ncbi:MAG TPA: hypothetical protein VM347_02830 [Nonomuraea sp.]|nr:hypothetical protein [Nonomuraea sp.]
MKVVAPSALASRCPSVATLTAHGQEPAAPHQHGSQHSPASSPAPAEHQSADRTPAAAPLPTFVPPVTAADREAAFPDGLYLQHRGAGLRSGLPLLASVVAETTSRVLDRTPPHQLPPPGHPQPHKPSFPVGTRSRRAPSP